MEILVLLLSKEGAAKPTPLLSAYLSLPSVLTMELRDTRCHLFILSEMCFCTAALGHFSPWYLCSGHLLPSHSKPEHWFRHEQSKTVGQKWGALLGWGTVGKEDLHGPYRHHWSFHNLLTKLPLPKQFCLNTVGPRTFLSVWDQILNYTPSRCW